VGLTGLGGLIYTIAVWRRLRAVKSYTKVLEDWVWHVAFPLLAYAATVVAAVALEAATLLSLFLIGGTSTLLVFLGIHNAWDTVTYVTMQRVQREEEKNEKTGK
jgi:phosphotransferase system  glucose/maltose/N-acetylglucosamine-specific IIC component